MVGAGEAWDFTVSGRLKEGWKPGLSVFISSSAWGVVLAGWSNGNWEPRLQGFLPALGWGLVLMFGPEVTGSQAPLCFF